MYRKLSMPLAITVVVGLSVLLVITANGRYEDKKKYNQLSSEYNVLNDTYQELVVEEDRLNAVLNELEGTVNGLNQSIMDLTDKINDVETQNQSLKTKISEIETQNQSLKTEISKKKQENESLRSEINSLKKENQSLSNKVQQKSTTSESNQLSKSVKGTQAYNTVMASRGQSANKELYVEATAYTAYCTGCSGLTKWKEIDLRANPDMKVIAVDPKVIPLGTKVYVEGYGYAVAADIGGDIKGNRIDVFIPTKEKAYEWGRKKVKVTILGA